MQFARLSPSGQFWAAEDGVGHVVVGRWGEATGTIIGKGWSPCWLQNDGLIWRFYREIWGASAPWLPAPATTRLVTLEKEINYLDAQGNSWAAYAGDESVYFSGQTFVGRWTPGMSNPAVSPDGNACLVNRSNGQVVQLDRDHRQTTLDLQPAQALVWREGGIAYVYRVGEQWRAVGLHAWDALDPRLVLPVGSASGRNWAVVLENDRLTVLNDACPINHGWVIVPTATTFRPDAVLVPPTVDRTGEIRVIWDDGKGALAWTVVDCEALATSIPKSLARRVPPQPEPAKPKITITRYPERLAVGERGVIVVDRDGGDAAPPSVIEVGLVGHEEDAQKFFRPRLPLSVDVSFSQPGKYAIYAEARLQGTPGEWRTGRPRTIEVVAATPEPPTLPPWEQFLAEAGRFPFAPTARYAMAYARLRCLGGPDGGGPKTPEEAWRFLYPDAPSLLPAQK